MKSLAYLLTLLSFTLLLACEHRKVTNNIAQVPLSVDTLTINEVSLIQLIATPERFDHKKISVSGYMHIEFEGNGLYLNETDYKTGITKNAVWVDLTRRETRGSSIQQCNDHYVRLKGKFNASSNGHMGAYSASIENITLVEKLR